MSKTIATDDSKKYNQIIQSGFLLLMDLFAQIINLIVTLNKEVQSIQETKDNENAHGGSPISVRALKTAIIFLEFNALETLANFFAEVTLQTNLQTTDTASTSKNLSQVEIDFLSEQRTSLDVKTGNLKVSKSAFVPTLDKISIVPLELFKLHGIEFKINKGDQGWQKLLKLKEQRDRLTHPRIDLSLLNPDEEYNLDLNNIKPAVIIESQDIFDGSEAIYWYINQLKPHLYAIEKKKFYALQTLEVMCLLMMMNLRESCGISESEFGKKYPLPNIKIKVENAT